MIASKIELSALIKLRAGILSKIIEQENLILNQNLYELLNYPYPCRERILLKNQINYVQNNL